MGWQLLKQAQDWDAYRAQFTIANKLERNLVVWGAGPTSYPCMVDGFAPSPTKVVTAYIYPQDAAILLNAYQMMQGQGQAQQAMGVLGGPQQARQAMPDGSERTTEFQWRAFSASTAAHILTVVEYLVETGIAKRDDYESRYNAQLAQVDQWSTEDRNERLARVTGKLDEQA